MIRPLLILSYFCCFLTTAVFGEGKQETASLKIDKSLSLADMSPKFNRTALWSVGFRSQVIADPWRQNRLPLDMKTLPERRQVLLNLWYPAAEHGSTQAHSSYFESSDVYASSYLNAYGRYRRMSLFQEAFSKTPNSTYTPVPQSLRLEDPEAFARPAPVLRDAQPAPGKFPVVFYHSGAQGGFEENAPLFELLAQQGIAVAVVIGPSEEGDIDATARSAQLKWDDMNLALASNSLDSYIDRSRIALMGFSAGAQASLNFAMTKGIFAAAVLLDTTYENQDFIGSPPRVDFLKEKGQVSDTPLLVLAEVGQSFGKAYRFRIYDDVKRAPMMLVDFGKDVSHDDFIWHGLVNRAAQEVFDKQAFEAAKLRYEAIAQITLAFLKKAFQPSPDWSELSTLQSLLPKEVYSSVRKGVPREISASELNLMLDNSSNLRDSIRREVEQGRLSRPHLSKLIHVIRYTQSAAKALVLCEAAKPLALEDRLDCAAIALESDNLEGAKAFIESYFQSARKPKKGARIFEKIDYQNALDLKGLIEKALSSQKLH